MKKNKKSQLAEEKQNAEMKSNALRRVLLFAFCVSGMAALIYEVAWTRTLTLVLGSTVYAVSTMLSTFMAGLALGGFLGGAAADKAEQPLFLFACAQILIGVTGAATLFLLKALPFLYHALYSHFHLSFSLYMFFQFAVCAFFMLVPTTLMGATFPLLSKVFTREFATLGKSVGGLYSINNVGAILGSLSAGFLFIPVLGVRGTILVAAGLNLFAGTAVLIFAKEVSRKMKFIPALSIITLVPSFFYGTGNAAGSLFNVYHAGRYKTYSEFQEETKNYKVVFNREDLHGTVKVFYDPQHSVYYLQNGGKVEGSTGQDVSTQVLLATLPAATNPGAKHFLGIGIGTGMTASEAAKRVRDVDWVEINASVVEASQKIFYPRLLQKINLIMDDARHYLNVTEKKYDVISSEPSYPTEAAAANLFTKEFYAISSAKLNPDGVFCQWVPYFVLNNEDMDILIHTFASVFPYTFIWEVPDSGDFLFVGSAQSIVKNPQEILQALKQTTSFIPKLVYSQEQVLKITQDMKRRNIPVNTDDRPLLEFAVAKNLILGSDNLK